MHRIIIGRESGDYIMIEIPFLAAQRDCRGDDDWVGANITVCSGVFRGCLSHDVFLRIAEFRPFLKQVESLYDSLEGTADFMSAEDWIRFKLSGDGLGHIIAQGYVSDRPGKPNRLCFYIEFDQTSLPSLIDSLKGFLGEARLGKK